MSKVVSIKSPATMTSLEIAEMTGKKHSHVMRDIRRMFDKLGEIPEDFMGSYRNSQNKTIPCYNLPKREVEILLTGYDVPTRAAVIDRRPVEPVVRERQEAPKTTGNALLDPSVPQMNSQQIAELVGSRHDDVKRSIDRLSDRGIIQHPPLAEVVNPQGQRVQQYVFSGAAGKRDSIIVVAQLSPEFTARLVDRWQELEDKVAKPQLPDFSNPVTLRQMLLGYTEKVIALEQKIEADVPKVEFYHTVADSSNSQTVQDVAKVFGMGPNKMFKFLRDNEILMEDNVPYQKHLDQGHFTVTERVFRKPGEEAQTYFRTYVTGKGLTCIAL